MFTGKYHPPVEVLFDRICRNNGIEHILTAPRSPTTTGKIERFHKTLRREFDTRRVFSSVKTAQQALDEWVAEYNTARPHQSLDDATRRNGSLLARPTRSPSGRSRVGCAAQRRRERRGRLGEWARLGQRG